MSQRQILLASNLNLLKPGQIIFCAMSQFDTNEPNRLMATAIGTALPYDRTVYGYLSEHDDTPERIGQYHPYSISWKISVNPC